MGIVCDTPSPKSITRPVVRPGAYRDKIILVAKYMACTLKISRMICFMRCSEGRPWAKTGFSSGATRVMQDFLHIVPICDDDQRSRQTRRKGVQYFYPAQGWRLRSHHGGRVRPRRSPARVRSEVATPRGKQHTFEQKHLTRCSRLVTQDP